jgi:hypothetical protein
MVFLLRDSLRRHLLVLRHSSAPFGFIEHVSSIDIALFPKDHAGGLAVVESRHRLVTQDGAVC